MKAKEACANKLSGWKHDPLGWIESQSAPAAQAKFIASWMIGSGTEGLATHHKAVVGAMFGGGGTVGGG